MSSTKSNTSGKSKKMWNATRGVSLSLMMLAAPAVGATAVLAAPGDAPVDGTVDIGVKGHWFGTQGAGVEVSLLADGTAVDTVTLTDSHIFEDVDVDNASGNPIVYTIQETDLAGYHSQVSGNVLEGFNVVNLANPDNAGFLGEPTDIDVEKSWIGDTGAKADVVLLIDGLVAKTVTLDSTSGWDYTFEDIPDVKNAVGEPVTYSVAELNSEGYDTIISGSQDLGFVVSNIQESSTQIEGTVTTKYVDQDGREIASRVNVSGLVGLDFGLSAKVIPGYKLVETKGEPTGLFAIGVSEVVYVYELIKDVAYIEGNIVSKFVDEDGKEIAQRGQVSGEIGTAFTLTPKVINGYTFKAADKATTGVYADGEVNVSFTYVKDTKVDVPVIGSIVTKYVNKEGLEIADRERVTGNIGTAYKTNVKTIKGYGLASVTGSATGSFGQGITIVEYVYDVTDKEAVVGGNITVTYVDANGAKIAEPAILKGNIGDAYASSEKVIKGYKFITVTGVAKGAFGKEVSTVSYMYVKDPTVIEEATMGTVVVTYVDEKNKEIAKREVLTGKIGEAFKTEEKVIAGYTFDIKQVTGDVGVYSKGATEVTYFYSVTDGSEVVSATSKLLVSYVDQDGVSISSPIELTGRVGEGYEAKQKEINGYKFVKTTGAVKGTHGETDTTVIYNYIKIPVVEDRNDAGENQVDTVGKPDANVPNVKDSGTNTLAAAYDKLQFGMTYDEAVKIIGSKGNLNVNPDLDKGILNGVLVPTSNVELYAWGDEKGNNLSLNFLNGKLASKGLVVDGETKIVYATESMMNEYMNKGINATDKTIQQDGNPDTIEGKRLADTATNTFNLLAIGGSLLALAGVGFVLMNRRRNASDSE